MLTYLTPSWLPFPSLNPRSLTFRADSAIAFFSLERENDIDDKCDDTQRDGEPFVEAHRYPLLRWATSAFTIPAETVR